jgi:hypothetical protein
MRPEPAKIQVSSRGKQAGEDGEVGCDAKAHDRSGHEGRPYEPHRNAIVEGDEQDGYRFCPGTHRTSPAPLSFT